MKRELLALALLILLALGFPASLFAYQAWVTNSPGVRVIEIRGNSPANGGWTPDTIRVSVGERVRLRISSTDVVHGLSVPALGIDVKEILPGHVAEVEFAAEKAGRYPFACTRWCSVDHWRMRGVIEVVDPSHPEARPTFAGAPLYQKLGIDLDAMHPASVIPTETPSAARGAALSSRIPSRYKGADWLRTQSPPAVWAALRAEEKLAYLSDRQLWDGVAWLWQQATSADAILRGQQQFAQDCAACHGERGKGDGPAGKNLPGLTVMHPEMKSGPADFTDPKGMLGASDALLQGKMLRGGMGTGMPEWGSLFTEQQMKDLTAYLRSLLFDLE